jgi:hypothetical protein
VWRGLRRSRAFPAKLLHSGERSPC